MKVYEVISFSIVIFVLLSSSVFASFTFHNETIQRTYAQGDRIQGTIILTLKNENALASITSTLGGNNTLLNLVRASGLIENIDYNCTSKNCATLYTAQEVTSSISVPSQGQSSFGFSIQGKDVHVRSLDFGISSSLTNSSCSPPISIRVMDSNETIITQSIQSDDVNNCGAKTSGCFNSGLSSGEYQEAVITPESSYCEHLTLQPAPAYYVGANLRVVGNSSHLVFELFNNESNFEGSCVPSVKNVGSGPVGCTINKTVTNADSYFLCVATSVDSKHYFVKTERSGSVCGRVGSGNIFTVDYDLFAQARPYAPMRNVSVNKILQELYGLRLADVADEYIASTYNRDCSKSCSLPFVVEGISQTLGISNVSLEFLSEDTTYTGTSSSRLERKMASLSSNHPLTISLAESGIIAYTNSSSLQLYLASSPILKKAISLNVRPGFEFNVTPKFALLGIDTTFSIITSQNISSAVWNFGDGSTATSAGKTTTHKYMNVTTYDLNVSARNSAGTVITRSFSISVGNASQAAQQLMNQYKERIENLTGQIAKLPSAAKPIAESYVNISELKSTFSIFEAEHRKAATDDDYIKIINDLSSFSVPKQILITTNGKIPLALGFTSLNVGYMEKISNGTVAEDQREELKLNLIDWNTRNYDSQIIFNVVSLTNYQGVNEEVITVVNIDLKPIGEKKTGSLIIDYPYEEISFAKNYGAESIEDDLQSGTRVPLGDEPQIEFAIKNKVNVEELSMYLAPKLEELGDYGPVEPYEAPSIPKGWLTFWIILLVVGSFVIYIILQEWYKRFYERHLFNNPDDLYNILRFINNSRTSGTADETIKKKLLGSGWTGEQMSYAFRKIDGKRTGMFEIPIFLAREQRKVQQELAKRQQNDGRKVY